MAGVGTRMWGLTARRTSVIPNLKGSLLTVIISSFVGLSLVTATSVNITVDDTLGNATYGVWPAYLPADDVNWHAGTPTEECDICKIKPSELDLNQILDQTWHHGTYFQGSPIQVQVTFTGTAVYVFNVVPNTLPGTDTLMNISFAIDGETVGDFFHQPNSSSVILYDQLVYSNATLPNTSHTLVMSASGDEESLIFFDYLLYTADIDSTGSSLLPFPTPTSPPGLTSSLTPSPISSTGSSTSPPSSHVPIAAIVGGVVGGVVGLLVIGALASFSLCRRSRGRARRPSESVRIATSTENASHSHPASLTHNITVAGQSLAPDPFSLPPSELSRSFGETHGRESMGRDAPAQTESEMRSPSHRATDSEDVTQLSSSVVQALQEEIAALRGMLSSSVVRIVHRQSSISDVLPQYEPRQDTSQEME